MQYYDKKAVGIRIKSIRNLRHLTQYELSKQLDYASERQLQRIENGETSCSVDKLMELSQILEISTDYLLFGTEKGQEGGFQKYFQNKTEKQVAFLCGLLETAGENLDLLCQ